MTDDGLDPDTAFLAHRCENGHLTYPGHAVCPTCGESQTETVSLLDREGVVRTWTTVGSTPVGVAEPKTLAIVEFLVDGATVRAIGTAAEDVAIGDRVEVVYAEELRDPAVGIRAPGSQRWDGVLFEAVAGEEQGD